MSYIIFGFCGGLALWFCVAGVVFMIQARQWQGQAHGFFKLVCKVLIIDTAGATKYSLAARAYGQWKRMMFMIAFVLLYAWQSYPWSHGQ